MSDDLPRALIRARAEMHAGSTRGGKATESGSPLLHAAWRFQ